MIEAGRDATFDSGRQLGLDRFFQWESDTTDEQAAVELGEEPLLVGDLVLCEVLRGVRSEAHANTVESELRKFELVTLLNPELTVIAAKHFRVLREQRVTIRKTIDLIIGTFCIANGHGLLHADRHFDPMKKYLGLKVVETSWAVNEPKLRGLRHTGQIASTQPGGDSAKKSNRRRRG